MLSKKKAFIKGLHDGIPIGLGYFAVAIAIGIAAHRAGMSILQAGVMSFSNVTSAGEAAGVAMIAAGTTYLEMAMTQLVINIRYLLMSCALSQKFSADMPVLHRFCVSFGVTDEIFAITAAKTGAVNPFYCYGAFAVAIPGWTLGTLAGAWIGSILPAAVVTALGVSLYGMFAAIVVPPAKENHVIAGSALAAMVLSFLLTVLPMLKNLSSGFRIIIVTVLISAGAALLFPLKDENGKEGDR